MPLRRKGTAFTLIELLVVLSILALMAAILFPVFFSVREKARQATCLSNLKQMGSAQMMYFEDYDDTLEEPILGGWNGTQNQFDRMWYAALFPYAKQWTVMTCPDSIHAGEPFDPVWTTGYGKQSLGMNHFLTPWYSYYFFVTLGGQYLTSWDPNHFPGYPRFIDQSMVKYPALTPLFTDTFEGHISPNSDMAQWAGTDPVGFLADAACGYGMPYGLSDRHSGGANLCFFDGHVKWFKVESVLNQVAWTGPIPGPTVYNVFAWTNYNNAGLVWDIDAPNMYTDPGKYSTFCCTSRPPF